MALFYTLKTGILKGVRQMEWQSIKKQRIQRPVFLISNDINANLKFATTVASVV